jgi:hypothetical protein
MRKTSAHGSAKRHQTEALVVRRHHPSVHRLWIIAPRAVNGIERQPGTSTELRKRISGDFRFRCSKAARLPSGNAERQPERAKAVLVAAGGTGDAA